MYIPVEKKITMELIFNSLKAICQFMQTGGRTHQVQETCALTAELICTGVSYRSL